MNAKVLYQITRLSVTANVGNHKNGIYLVADQLLKGKQMPGGGKITKAKVLRIKKWTKDTVPWKNGKHASVHNTIFENHSQFSKYK